LRNHPLLLVEALPALALASVLIAILPFRWIAKLAAGGGGRAHPPASLTEGQLIGSAVGAWAALVPWRAVCFQQGLAALLMLRRRGLAATLFYGAAHSRDSAVVAHVWVQSVSVDVIGCETAEDYALLATFPSRTD
jgi:Transglutaminase-like superfamily